MDDVYLCRPPAPGELVGWVVRDPSGAVLAWGPPLELEMAAEIGDAEKEETTHALAHPRSDSV